MHKLTGKIVTIIGAQRSGMALAKLASRAGAQVQISEQLPEEDVSQQFREWAKQNNVLFEYGGHTQAFIEKSDCLLLSPGVRFDAPPVRWAQQKNIPVLGEIEFASQFCSIPIIAVTGSNGKTTVVNLIHEVLKRAGIKSVLCGNIGYPFSECVDSFAGADYVVLEISSFQTESMLDPSSPHRKQQNGAIVFEGFKPYIAVLLNFSENHLDRHKDIDDYWQAKTRIFLNQNKFEFAVLNGDDERIRKLADEINAQARLFHASGNPNHSAVREVAKVLGIAESICDDVFQSFKGVEHRLEWVRNLDGVDFVNDSKATTAQAGQWALEHIDQPVVMICGGKDKNIDFTPLKGLMKDKVKKMLVFGEASHKLSSVFKGVINVEECDELETAVQKAKESADSGDCIVLSPMCASFDMFQDYEHRGKRYKEIVNQLK